MNYHVAVIRAAWRRIKSPSRYTMRRLAALTVSAEVWGVRTGRWNDDLKDVEFGEWIKADSGNDFKTDNWRVAFELISKLQADGARGIFIQSYPLD